MNKRFGKLFVMALTAAVVVFLATSSGIGATKKKADDPAVIAKGKALYAAKGCPACHGPEGNGDGAAAARFPAEHKPANFTSGVFKFGGDDAKVRESILKGRPPYMPGNASLKDEELAALSAFVRSLKKK